MKKIVPAIFALMLISITFISPSCTPKDPTVGSLSVYVLDFYTGFPVANEQVYLATSYINMQKGGYYAVTWTDLTGRAYFGDLPPAYYWFDTYDWQDWGAVQTYAGHDQYVYLYVNVSQKKSNK